MTFLQPYVLARTVPLSANDLATAMWSRSCRGTHSHPLKIAAFLLVLEKWKGGGRDVVCSRQTFDRFRTGIPSILATFDHIRALRVNRTLVTSRYSRPATSLAGLRPHGLITRQS